MEGRPKLSVVELVQTQPRYHSLHEKLCQLKRQITIMELNSKEILPVHSKIALEFSQTSQRM